MEDARQHEVDIQELQRRHNERMPMYFGRDDGETQVVFRADLDPSTLPDRLRSLAKSIREDDQETVTEHAFEMQCLFIKATGEYADAAVAGKPLYREVLTDTDPKTGAVLATKSAEWYAIDGADKARLARFDRVGAILNRFVCGGLGTIDDAHKLEAFADSISAASLPAPYAGSRKSPTQRRIGKYAREIGEGIHARVRVLYVEYHVNDASKTDALRMIVRRLERERDDWKRVPTLDEVASILDSGRKQSEVRN